MDGERGPRYRNVSRPTRLGYTTGSEIVRRPARLFSLRSEIRRAHLTDLEKQVVIMRDGGMSYGMIAVFYEDRGEADQRRRRHRARKKVVRACRTAEEKIGERINTDGKQLLPAFRNERGGTPAPVEYDESGRPVTTRPTLVTLDEMVGPKHEVLFMALQGG